jgi:hypothetical protein
MNQREFFHRVVAHPNIEYLGCHEGATPQDDAVIVRCVSRNVFVVVNKDGIRNEPWEILEAVMLIHRTPAIMQRMSRIIGYYSNMRNWNKSKLAELADRQRGNYGFGAPAQSVDIWPQLPMLARGHLPLRVYGSRMCGRCQEVKGVLKDKGITVVPRDLVPEELSDMQLSGVDRNEGASFLAAITAQDGLLPVVMSWDFNLWIPQRRIAA